MTKYYILLAVAIITETIATMCLKSSEQFTKLLPSMGVIIGYAIAFYSLSVCQKVFPVAIIYAIWSAVGIMLVTIFAAIIFKQIPDAPAVIGSSLIILGVVVINLFSKTIQH
jgi:small multidrug resistance pump